MNFKNIKIILLLSIFTIPLISNSQGSSEYNGGFKIKMNEDGSSFIRIISWAQVWANYNASENVPENNSKLDFSIRRARTLMFAQVSPKFMILTHFGLNSLNANNMSPVGKGSSSQLFWHDVWGQYSIGKNHAIGGGLHYWNGISRANNQSTLNMLTLDNNRQSWSTIGLTDQFARHLGIYMKGKLERLQYRISVNEALANNIQASAEATEGGPAVYNGRNLLGSSKASKCFSGYFDYNFLDQESNYLPFKVGSYVGTKKVFNIGAGFFYHPNGAAIWNTDDTAVTGQDVTLFSVDAFYDAPLGEGKGAITAYGQFQTNNYGDNYTLGQTYETGNMFYGHVGYVFPSKEGAFAKVQPYVSFTSRGIDALNGERATRYGVGANMYMSGHNSKLTLEYNNQSYPGVTDNRSNLLLQAMIYL